MEHHNPLTWLTDRATSTRGRWAMLALWLVVTGALSATAPKLANYYNNRATTSIGDQDSVRAAALVKEQFPDQNGVPAIIVISNPQKLTSADEVVATQLSCWLSSDAQRAALKCPTLTTDLPRPAHVGTVLSTFTVPQASSQLVSADGTTMTIIATVNTPADDVLSLRATIDDIRKLTDTLDGQNGLQVKLTGPGGILADLVEIFSSTDVKLLLTTVLLVLVLLIVIYRSPILAILPLVGVGLALQVVNAILGFAAKAELFPISQQSASIMNVLLFGAGTDYVIFIVARYREELQREPDRQKALQTTMRGVGEAITSSAGTVIAALLTLVLAVLGLYSSLGLVSAIAIAVMLIAGLTLVPAILSVIGRVAFWPFIPKLLTEQELAHHDAQPERGFWATIARFVGRRPIVAVVSSVGILGVLALGNIGVPDVYNSLTDLRKPTSSTEGYKLLADHFEPGTLAPFNVVVHLKDGDIYQQLVALDAITQSVDEVNHIASVRSATRPDGKPTTIDPSALQAGIAQLPDEVKAAIRSGSAPPATGGPPTYDPQFIGYYAATISTVSVNGSTALIPVTLDIDPYSVPALDTMTPVRQAARDAATKAGLTSDAVTIELNGVTPQLADTRAVSERDRMIVVPLVLLLVGIILALLLRSLVAPLYLLFAVTLNYFAALGASAFLFTKIQGDEGMSYATPLYTFIFLVALGADYTIFLMSRVREEATKRGLLAGTQVALSRTGGVITSAGLILAGTFLVLTTLPLRTLYSFGVAVALGVILDTFIVRGLLVPGVVILLGKWNWWPRRVSDAA